ncbi:MAG: GTPase HflX [Opitutales bacterium]
MPDVVEKPKMVTRAFLVGCIQDEDTVETGKALLDELAELVRTLGIDIAGRSLVKLRDVHPRFLTGTGKTQAIIEEAQTSRADVIVFDNELTPGQQRNWEVETGEIAVIDRQEIILDIFAERAQTREAVLQVALARAEYNLPRLQRAWTHLDRQRGGGAVQRDAGETQLEMDQRMVRDRISRLKRELEKVTRHRDTQRKRRMKVPVPSGAIVGYTNAGKSSLLNNLTGATILAEDKLFATLDPTSRRLRLKTGHTLVLTDTVGFVRRLPHRLVQAFKATLEEALVADFLIHVVDASSPEAAAHIQTTGEVLEELGAAAKTTLLVLNKIDQVPETAPAADTPEEPGKEPPERVLTRPELATRFPEGIPVSAVTGEGMDRLQERIAERIDSTYASAEWLFPHDRYDLVAQLHQLGCVTEEEPRDDGVYVLGKVPHRMRDTFDAFALNGHRLPERQPDPWEQ